MNKMSNTKVKKVLLLGLIFTSVGSSLLNTPRLIKNFFEYNPSDFMIGFFDGLGVVTAILGLAFIGTAFGKGIEQKIKK